MKKKLILGLILVKILASLTIIGIAYAKGLDESTTKNSHVYEAQVLYNSKDVKSMIGVCSYNEHGVDFGLINIHIADKLAENQMLQIYSEAGYVLKNLCMEHDKLLILLDAEQQYFRAANEGALDDSLNEIARKIVVAVGNDFDQLDFYNIRIPDYRFEGEGDMSCIIAEVDYNAVKINCRNASSSGLYENEYSLPINEIPSQTCTNNGYQGYNLYQIKNHEASINVYYPEDWDLKIYDEVNGYFGLFEDNSGSSVHINYPAGDFGLHDMKYQYTANRIIDNLSYESNVYKDGDRVLELINISGDTWAVWYKTYDKEKVNDIFSKMEIK